MADKINVQIRENGKLLKELTEYNMIIISEYACGEMFNHIGISEATLLLAQLSKEYDRMLEWVMKNYPIDKESIGDLIKAAKIHLELQRQEVIKAPKNAGDDE